MAVARMAQTHLLDSVTLSQSLHTPIEALLTSRHVQYKYSVGK